MHTGCSSSRLALLSFFLLLPIASFLAGVWLLISLLFWGAWPSHHPLPLSWLHFSHVLGNALPLHRAQWLLMWEMAFKEGDCQALQDSSRADPELFSVQFLGLASCIKLPVHLWLYSRSGGTYVRGDQWMNFFLPKTFTKVFQAKVLN